MPNCVECLSESQHCVNRSDYERIISKINLEQINLGTKNITYVGQMVFEQKVQGMVDFLKAFDEFLNEWDSPEKKKLMLIFIGGGPYKNILLEAHSRSIHTDQILILGYRTDVENFHAISELSALTSYREGFPNAILESMVMGVPCIGSDVGEIREIIGDTGFIIKPGDIPAIKNALFLYFSDPNLQEVLKTKCFKRVKTLYCCNKIGKKYNILYKKICSSSVSRPITQGVPIK